MPVLTKLALHLSRFAAASHQSAASSLRGAFQSSGAAGSAAGSSTGAGSASGWAGGLSSAGGSAGAGAGGAKFHAGRGAYSTYSAGRGLAQANASSSDGSNSRTDEDEERAQAGVSTSSSRKGKLRSQDDSRRRTLVTSTGQLTGSEMRIRFSHAFSTTRGQMLITSSAIETEPNGSTSTTSPSPNNERVRRNSTSAVEGAFVSSTPIDASPEIGSMEMEFERVSIANDVNTSKASPQSLSELPLYSQLMAVQRHRNTNEVTARALVRKFRNLDPSQQATASYNAALEALFWIRLKGQSVKVLTDTYVEMIEKNIIPNNRTFSVLVRALCANDSEIQEKKQDLARNGSKPQADQISEESAEDSFSQALQLMGVAHTSDQWFSSAEPYNALLKSCAYRGNSDQAISILGHLESSQYTAPDSDTFKHLIDTFCNGSAHAGETETETRQRKLEACNHVFKSWEENRAEESKKEGEGAANANADRGVWNSLIRAHFQLGDESGGITLLERMLSALTPTGDSSAVSSSAPTPDAATFSTIISAFLQESDTESALTWFFKLYELRKTSVEILLPLPDGATLMNLASSLCREIDSNNEVENTLALNKVLSAFYDQAAESISTESEDSPVQQTFFSFGLFNSAISKLLRLVDSHLQEASSTSASDLDASEKIQLANALLDDLLGHIEFQYRLFADQLHSSSSLVNCSVLTKVVKTLVEARRHADAGAVLSYAVFAMPQVTQDGSGESTRIQASAMIRSGAMSVLGVENVDRNSSEELASLEQASSLQAPASVLLQVGANSIKHVLNDVGGSMPTLFFHRIASLYRLARKEVNGSIEELGLDPETVLTVQHALKLEEFRSRPVDFEAFKTDGLGMLVEDAMKLEKASANDFQFLDIKQIYETTFSRYGAEKALELVERYSPNFARSVKSSGDRSASSRSDSISQSVSGSETALSQSANGSNGYTYTETVSTPPLSPIYKSMPPLQEIPDIEPLSQTGPSVEEMQAQMQAQVSNQPQLWPMPAPAAPVLGDLPPIQVVDTDLGRMIESMVRTFQPKQRGRDYKPAQPDPEGAYSQLMSALQVGTYPSPESVVSLMNSFGRAGDVARVHQLYSIASVAISGLVGNPQWQAKAWCSVEDGMICALAHAGEGEMASIHRHRLIAGGKVPSANAYAALIATIKDTTDDALIAQELFDESQRLGCRPNTYLFNTVISKLSRARKAERALQLFDLMTSPELNLTPTSVTYGAVINAYVRTGDEESAVQLFDKMERDRGFKPRVPPYNTMIQFFTSTKPDRNKAEVFIEKMRKWRVEPSAHTYKLFLDLYGNMQPVLPEKVSSVFSQLVNDPKVQVQGTHWASLITSSGIHQSNLEEAISIFESISNHPSTTKDPSTNKPHLPDSVSFEALLSVFIHHSRSDLMKSWITKMTKETSSIQLNPTAYIANVLIRGYSTISIEEAREVFEEMIDPAAGKAAAGNHLPRQHGAGAGGIIQESTSTNQSINGNGGGKHGFGGVFREPSTYETMIKSELNSGELEKAEELIHRMELRAFPPALIIRARGLLEEARLSSSK